jgi:hypothetical protein
VSWELKIHDRGWVVFGSTLEEAHGAKVLAPLAVELGQMHRTNPKKASPFGKYQIEPSVKSS